VSCDFLCREVNFLKGEGYLVKQKEDTPQGNAHDYTRTLRLTIDLTLPDAAPNVRAARFDEKIRRILAATAEAALTEGIRADQADCDYMWCYAWRAMTGESTWHPRRVRRVAKRTWQAEDRS
jgi:hypothetical protein